MFGIKNKTSLAGEKNDMILEKIGGNESYQISLFVFKFAECVSNC